MKKNQTRCVLFAMTILLSALVNAQSPVTIVLKGTLTDMEDVNISNETFEAQLRIINTSEKILLDLKIPLTSSESGEFTLPARDIPKIFNEGAGIEMVDIEINIFTDGNSSWLPDGKFGVKYHLEKTGDGVYKLTRFEGQTLDQLSENMVWSFNDIYPLAYLKSNFMFSFNPEISDPDVLIAACEELNASAMEKMAPAPVQERGIKGGYAVGGYKTKK